MGKHLLAAQSKDEDANTRFRTAGTFVGTFLKGSGAICLRDMVQALRTADSIGVYHAVRCARNLFILREKLGIGPLEVLTDDFHLLLMMGKRSRGGF